MDKTTPGILQTQTKIRDQYFILSFYGREISKWVEQWSQLSKVTLSGALPSSNVSAYICKHSCVRPKSQLNMQPLFYIKLEFVSKILYTKRKAFVHIKQRTLLNDQPWLKSTKQLQKIWRSSCQPMVTAVPQGTIYAIIQTIWCLYLQHRILMIKIKTSLCSLPSKQNSAAIYYFFCHYKGEEWQPYMLVEMYTGHRTEERSSELSLITGSLILSVNSSFSNTWKHFIQ